MNELLKITVTDDQKQLAQAARPLVDYIRKHFTPMTTAIVTGVNVEILNTEIGIKINDEWD